MDIIRKIIQSNQPTYKSVIKLYAISRGIEVSFGDDIRILRDKKLILLRRSHINHVRGIVDYFDFFHNSVQSEFDYNFQIVDFRTAKFQKISNFILSEFHMPSIAEPLITAEIYARYLELKPGMNILDLGSYSGLTGIYFNEIVSKENGKVILVEPDPINFESLQINLLNYLNVTGKTIQAFNVAIYKKDGNVTFVSEQSMDSAILGNARNLMVRSDHLKTVKALKLSTLASEAQLEKIDCIKADIEGSELDAFTDDDFFGSFHPKIIIEPIAMKGPKGAAAIQKQLAKYGYERQDVPQEGARVPLIIFK